MRNFCLVGMLWIGMSSLGVCAEVLRVGIVGADTSHAFEFAKVLNAQDAPAELSGFKVVAVFPGGSNDIPSSKDRVAGFTEKINALDVEVVESVDALLPKVDVVLLESVDGRVHLKQALQVLKAHKPVFIDKPFAASLTDVLAIFKAAKDLDVPCFSSSSLRYTPAIAAVSNDPKVGRVNGCEAYGPCALEPHHPDLFWYGIHGVETLFTIMGSGCESVARVQTQDYEVVTGVWKDGRIGIFRGLRVPKQDYGALVFGSKSIVSVSGFGGYTPLVVEIAKFFKTGKAPVSADQTIEIYAFMAAADESKRLGGAPVKLETVLTAAR